jgi:hypothetical protein
MPYRITITLLTDEPPEEPLEQEYGVKRTHVAGMLHATSECMQTGDPIAMWAEAVKVEEVSKEDIGANAREFFWMEEDES